MAVRPRSTARSRRGPASRRSDSALALLLTLLLRPRGITGGAEMSFTDLGSLLRAGMAAARRATPEAQPAAGNGEPGVSARTDAR